MQVVAKSIDDIKPYKNNPRNNDDAVDAVANSIKEFGWQQPIVVDIKGVIIAGHTRYKAAQKLDLKTVPVVIAKDLSEEQAKAYRLADNKSGELADWDFSVLDDELGQISDIDMSQFGFDELSDDSDDSDDANVNDLDLSDDITDKYELKVSCNDEKSLERLFDRLKGEGYKCDIL
ncbi:ParB N-terminal domain-containing protein [Lactobacillus helveticus]|uniref:ParB N-terminal domain-containing protein n=1 Tax=Lactobacillus helveticus TaxID=1587 RepID=UPI00062AC209|nr:ParB N-terminal domain-containing protein [Lactobacillus helveticus]AKG66636.1 plasmid partitioning protein ParB [Lactobacillus helveticus]